jgi:uncharacterized protein
MQMTLIPLRDAAPDVLAAVLALNEADKTFTSEMDAARLARMVAASPYAVAAVDGGQVLAFLIGFDPASAYDSPNFIWFRDRLPRFAYVDRIVVSPAARGRGLARALYAAFDAHARMAGLEQMVCEVYSDPPNPVSDAFHARLGFATVGTAQPWPGKTVRYLARALDTPLGD